LHEDEVDSAVILLFQQFQRVAAIFTEDSDLDSDTFFTMAEDGLFGFDSNDQQIRRSLPGRWSLKQLSVDVRSPLF
jgi:hypothetical protein